MVQKLSKGFNTTIQQVDERYAWINDMIRSRQELVLKYMQLLNIDPKSLIEGRNGDELKLHSSISLTAAAASLPEDDASALQQTTAAQISDFCDHLIDYISHGHFDLYPKIVELIENASGRSASIAHRVMPKIEATTECLMRFNDRYAENLDEAKLKTLRQDLATVGECLEQRFRSEDRLIVGLRLVHSIVATPRNA